MSQDPAVVRDEPGFRRKNRVPHDESVPGMKNQGPAGRIRVPMDGSGPLGKDRGPAVWIRAPQEGSGPHESDKGIDGPGSRNTNQGPAG